jgi:hypothetical protein
MARMNDTSRVDDTGERSSPALVPPDIKAAPLHLACQRIPAQTVLGTSSGLTR